MVSRICFVLICLVALTGCYTQIRPPRVEKEHSAAPTAPPAPVEVQRFEYYNQNIIYDYCDPFHVRTIPVYTPYFPRPYPRYPHWRRDRLVWEYSCWATVYDPWWRGYPPHIVVPRVVYASVPRDIDREDGVSRPPNPRPRVRRTGIDSAPVSANTVRTGSTSTRTTPRSTVQSGSTKTQPTSTDDKKEMREQKRADRTRKGGMSGTPASPNTAQTRERSTRSAPQPTSKSNGTSTQSSPQPTSKSSGTKTQPPKEKDDEEKREEKRSERRKRGGMR